MDPASMTMMNFPRSPPIYAGAVEVGYPLRAAMGSPKSDFPQQRPGCTHLPSAQSGSNSAQQVCRFLSFVLEFQENKTNNKSSFVCRGKSAVIQPLDFEWCAMPQDRALREPNAIPYLIIAYLQRTMQPLAGLAYSSSLAFIWGV